MKLLGEFGKLVNEAGIRLNMLSPSSKALFLKFIGWINGRFHSQNRVYTKFKQCPVLTRSTRLPHLHLHEPFGVCFAQRMNMLPLDKLPEAEISLRICILTVDRENKVEGFE